MYLIFVDEAGYTPGWSNVNLNDLNEQPVYVVSGVAIKENCIQSVYDSIINKLKQLNITGIDISKLGKGEEIKAKEVDRGEGIWRHYFDLRDEVRKIYMDHDNVIYFAVCIDKKRHITQYFEPENPEYLALRFLLERVQGLLNDQNELGLVVIDFNRRIEQDQRKFVSELLIEGSQIKISNFLEFRLQLDRIIEFYFCDSQNSLGLQIADFVARHIYSWWKKGKNPNYPGWCYIEKRLYKPPTRTSYYGWGYKEFP
ncbi:MAG: DUF3800 domain-containing protein [Caldisericum sp.]|jgi:hypothetical protein|nr:DUF3800 domain-containing protein [Caldisericum sp.]